jgi:hypothetical protein
VSDPQKIREALSKLTPAEREELEIQALSWHARTRTPLRHVVATPNGPSEAFSRVLEIPMPDGYTGPRAIRIRRASGAGLAGLDLTETTP